MLYSTILIAHILGSFVNLASCFNILYKGFNQNLGNRKKHSLILMSETFFQVSTGGLLILLNSASSSVMQSCAKLGVYLAINAGVGGYIYFDYKRSIKNSAVILNKSK